jgi:hypothetical protein
MQPDSEPQPEQLERLQPARFMLTRAELAGSVLSRISFQNQGQRGCWQENDYGFQSRRRLHQTGAG